MRDRLCQMQKIIANLQLYHHWKNIEHLNTKVLHTQKKVCSLVNEATHVLGSVRIILDRHQLMCVPNQVYIQSRYEERGGGRSHKIQEPKEIQDILLTLTDYSRENERMVSANGMLECKFIVCMVEKTRTSPS